MPSKNTVKEFAEDQYYHLYNRGVEKRVVFLDQQDYAMFLGLLKKYLTGDSETKTHRHKFDNLSGQVSLLAYCLMPNHFHLLLYQTSQDAITKLMRRIMTGYVMYFNNRYSRVGTLFQGTYKASHVNADDYLHHISRYIHMNADNYKAWPYSSLKYYKEPEKAPSWLNPQVVLELFDNKPAAYEKFIKDYENSKQELSVLKWQLANDPEEA